jgi:hypothetical protein
MGLDFPDHLIDGTLSGVVEDPASPFIPKKFLRGGPFIRLKFEAPTPEPRVQAAMACGTSNRSACGFDGPIIHIPVILSLMRRQVL